MAGIQSVLSGFGAFAVFGFYCAVCLVASSVVFWTFERPMSDLRERFRLKPAPLI